MLVFDTLDMFGPLTIVYETFKQLILPRSHEEFKRFLLTRFLKASESYVFELDRADGKLDADLALDALDDMTVEVRREQLWLFSGESAMEFLRKHPEEFVVDFNHDLDSIREWVRLSFGPAG